MRFSSWWLVFTLIWTLLIVYSLLILIVVRIVDWTASYAERNVQQCEVYVGVGCTQVTVRSAEIHNKHYDKGVQVKYCVRGEDDRTETPMVVQADCLPQFNHNRVITLACVVEEHLEYFDTGCITFFVYGKQVDLKPDKQLQKMTTRVRTEQYCLNVSSRRRR